jgi:hypothetical protein
MYGYSTGKLNSCQATGDVGFEWSDMQGVLSWVAILLNRKKIIRYVFLTVKQIYNIIFSLVNGQEENTHF